MELKRYIIIYLLFSLFLAGISWTLPLIFPSEKIMSPFYWGIFAFVAGLTFIASVLVFLGLRLRPETGVMSIMISIALKLFFSIAFILIFSLKYKKLDLIFVFNFFSLYLLFTCFEIFALLRNLRHQNRK